MELLSTNFASGSDHEGREQENNDVSIQLRSSTEPLQVRLPEICDLPVEILAYIISIVQSIAPASKQFHTAMVLSQVNSLWRETCLSFSALWSCIHVVRGSHTEAESVKLSLERSGTCPLTIDFRANPESKSGSYTPEAKAIISKLFAECGRWKEASFPVFYQTFEALRSEGAELRFQFPLLEKLSLPRSVGHSHQFLDIFRRQYTPRLHTLVIPDYDFRFPFAFDQVTSLTLCAMKTALPDFSRICPLLTHLEVVQTFAPNNADESADLSPVTLPLVKTLAVRCSGPGKLWSQLTLPSLQNLELKAISFLPLEYIAILNMLRRSNSGTTVRRLSLAGVDVNDIEIGGMLSLLPCLEELVLQETLFRQQKVITPKLFVALKASGSAASAYESYLIPCLALIELDVYYSSTFRLDLLFDMLLSRIPTPTVLPSPHSPILDSVTASISENQLLLTTEQNHTSSVSRLLRDVRLCFTLPIDSPQGLVPFDLAKMVNKLRLASTADIYAKAKTGRWQRDL